MSSFQPSGYSGPLTAETGSWDFFEADRAEASVPIPFVGNDISWASLHPGRHAAAAKRRAEEATSPGLSPLPVGDKEMVLITSGQEGDSSPLHDEPQPFYEKEWFWPVVLFGVVMGFVSSSRD